MSDELLQTAIDLFNQGDIDGAIEYLDSKLSGNSDSARMHHMYAEFANMKNSEAQEDVVPGRKIMMM